MKKLFVLSATCILIMLSATNTTAQTVASGTSGACTWTLTGTSSNYTLTISGSGAMANYSYAATPWYEYRSGIKTLNIQEGVTAIGDFTAHECSGLTSVTVPNSVTRIRRAAFQTCSGLTSAVIGNSVTELEHYAFFGCSALASITIPNSVRLIEYSAFSGCSSATTLTIGNSVDSIKELAFENLSSLTQINVKAVNPPGLAVDAFQGVSLTIPVYVCGTVDAYRASVWNVFTDIRQDNNCASAIEDISLQDITLLPNPATDKVTVLLPETSGNALITLCDMQGKILIRQEIANQQAIEVSHLANGIYLYQITAGTRHYQGKLVKN